MPRKELDPKQYKKFLEANLEKIVCDVTRRLIAARQAQPLILEDVLAEAHAVLHTRKFNNHQPDNELAWHILSSSIRVHVEFEFQRIHLIALVFQQLSDYSLDEFILDVETETMHRMIA